MSEGPWQVAPMTRCDLPAALFIEGQSPAPWNATQLAEELAYPAGIQLVCRSAAGRRVGGFLMARLIPEATEILKVATALEFRRQGVASALLASFISLAERRGITTFHLELRAGNLAARALYEKFAFEMTGRRRRYYTDPQDDALCMTLSVTPRVSASPLPPTATS